MATYAEGLADGCKAVVIASGLAYVANKIYSLYCRRKFEENYKNIVDHD